VLPSTVAYLGTNQLWTAPQTYSSSETVTSPLGLGVTYGITAGSVNVNGVTYSWPNSNGSGGSVVLTNNGSGSLSWAATGAGSYILNSNSLQSNSTFYVTSGTVAGPFAATGTVTLGGAGNAVTISSNLVVSAGGVISGNGSGITSLTGGNLTGTVPSTVLPSTVAYTSVANTFTSSQTITAAGGLGVTYGLNVGSMTGAGLANCTNDGAHALIWSNVTNQFSCQAITGSGAASLLTSSNTWSGTNTYASSVTVTAPLGINVTYGVVAGSITGNGSGITNLNANSLASGVVGTNVLPSTIAYTNTAELWSQPQTFSSSVTVNNAVSLGSAGNAVTVSSNLVVSGAIVANGSAGTSGYILQSQGPGLTPTWITSPANTLLSSSNTWTGTNTYASSVTVTAPLGMNVTYGVVAGSFTGNGSGLTNLPASGLVGTNLPGGSTSYVQISNSLQASSTFYVSSGTVNSLNVGTSISLPANSVAAGAINGGTNNNNFTFGGALTLGGASNAVTISSNLIVSGGVISVSNGAGASGSILSSQGPGAAPQWIASPANTLLSSSNTWTGTNTYASSVTVTAPLGINVTYGVVAGSFTGNGSGLTNLNANSLASGVVGTNVLPSTVAYLGTNQLWTAPQTYSSSETVTSPLGLGVTYGITAGSVNVNGVTYSWPNSNGSGGSVVLTNNGSGSLSWAATGAGSYILNSNSLQSNSTFYVTSGTVAGPFAATGTVTLGGAGNAVTISSNLVVSAGGVISGNGSGITSLTGGNLTGTVPSTVLPSTVAYTSVANTFTSSQTITAAGGLGVTYGLNVGSMTGAGLANCTNDGAHALIWSNVTNQFSCQAITGSGAASLLTSSNTWSGTNTYASSVTVTAPLGINVTYGVVAGSITGNGSGITNLNANSLASGVVGTNVLPSTIAYTNTAELWSQPQTFSSSVTVNNAVSLGSAGNAVTVSSNLVVSGAIVANGSAGTSGYILQSQGPGLTPTWITSPANTLLSSSNTWTGTNTYASSVTVTAPLGMNVTYGITTGSMTVTGSTISVNSVTTFWPSANAIGALTNNGSGLLTWTPAASGGLPLPAGATNYIQVSTGPLQVGATFYVSSGTVATNLSVGGVFSATGTVTLGSTSGTAVTVSSNLVVSGALVGSNGAGTSGYILQSQGPGLAPTWITSPASSLLTTTNTWSAAQTFTSSVTFSSNVVMNNASITMTNSSIAISSGVLGSSIYQNGSSCNVNWANGNTQYISLGTNCTMNFSGGVSGRKYVLIIKYTGSFAPAGWSGGTTVRFPGGVTPPLTSVNNKTDYLAFMYNDVNGSFDNLAETLNY